MSSDQRIRNILADATALHWKFHELEEKVERYEAALRRIEDPTPSMGRPSFRDWELRQIARDALKSCEDSKDKS